jgi:hypothetical protein
MSIDDMEEVQDCYCCKMRLAKNDTEWHHFPMAKQFGGTLTVPLCTTCHNHIDRIPLAKWNPDTFVKGFIDLVSTREGRLFFMKMSMLMQATGHIEADPCV